MSSVCLPGRAAHRLKSFNPCRGVVGTDLIWPRIGVNKFFTWVQAAMLTFHRGCHFVTFLKDLYACGSGQSGFLYVTEGPDTNVRFAGSDMEALARAGVPTWTVAIVLNENSFRPLFSILTCTVSRSG